MATLAAALSDDAKNLTVISEAAIEVIELDSSKLRKMLRANPEGPAKGAIIASGARRALVWDENGRALLWDLQEGMVLKSFVGSETSSQGCTHCDVRLSTFATTSARFPLVSPPGDIRDPAGTVRDRVVDGAYFEGFGATTALELAAELERQFALTPRVILINNEASVAGMNCIAPGTSIEKPQAPAGLSLPDLQAPLLAVLRSRDARGTQAAVDLCEKVRPENFAFITVAPDPGSDSKTLSMSWWLSIRVQKYLDDQVEADLAYTNKRAWEKIQSWLSPR